MILILPPSRGYTSDRDNIVPVVPLFGQSVHPTVELPHITDGSHVVSVLGLGLLRHKLPGDVDGGGRLVVRAGRHLEDDLHVVGGAGPPGPLVELRPGAGGDEVVVLARVELQPVWGRTERPAMIRMLMSGETQIDRPIDRYRPFLTWRKYFAQQC